MDRVLIDTSIWIEFFRSASRAGDELERLLREDTVWTCGIVAFELLQGVKSGREKSIIMDTLLNLEYIEMSWSHWQKAADMSIRIKENGLALPLSDLFIASIAVEHDLRVFTLDKHFKKIPGVKLYSF